MPTPDLSQPVRLVKRNRPCFSSSLVYDIGSKNGLKPQKTNSPFSKLLGRSHPPSVMMDITHFLCLIFLFNFCSPTVQGSELSSTTDFGKKKVQTYIVHVEPPEVGVLGQSDKLDLENWHKSFLPFSTASSDGQQRMVHSYKNVISGFAARLTEEVQAMRTKKGFISARPQRILRTQTTHTPKFLGLQQEMGIWKRIKLWERSDNRHAGHWSFA
ncbi:Proteinase inhibitor I9 [Corchorus capsularis]|uniref:Proteinase inhibitor I9 n=1 Tax=Corchorus capsularis TaxID=210143 RepID=A0A1R3J4C2_COCAP|nr:Proteinase inhibitor I9 [Corchorus capsularis]